MRRPANDCARPGSLVDLRYAPPTAGRFAGGRFPLRPRRIVVGLSSGWLEVWDVVEKKRCFRLTELQNTPGHAIRRVAARFADREAMHCQDVRVRDAGQ